MKKRLPQRLTSNRVKRDFYDESSPVSSTKSSNWGDDFLRMLPIIGNGLLAKDETQILNNERLLHDELMLVKHFVYNNSLLTGSAFSNLSHSLADQEKDFVAWEQDRHLFSALQEFVQSLFLAAEGRLSPELIGLPELQSVYRKIKRKCDKDGRILLWEEGWNIYDIETSLQVSSSTFTVSLNVPTAVNKYSIANSQSNLLIIHELPAKISSRRTAIDENSKTAFAIPKECKKRRNDIWCSEPLKRTDNCTTAILQEDKKKAETSCQVSFLGDSEVYTHAEKDKIEIYCPQERKAAVNCDGNRTEFVCAGIHVFQGECEAHGKDFKVKSLAPNIFQEHFVIADINGGEKEELLNLIKEGENVLTPAELKDLRRDEFSPDAFRRTTAGRKFGAIFDAVNAAAGSVSSFFSSIWTGINKLWTLLVAALIAAIFIAIATVAIKIVPKKREPSLSELYQLSLRRRREGEEETQV